MYIPDSLYAVWPLLMLLLGVACCVAALLLTMWFTPLAVYMCWYTYMIFCYRGRNNLCSKGFKFRF